MSTILFDVTAFRAQFPAFSNVTNFPTATLQLYWDNATDYINDQTGGAYCGVLNTSRKTLALNYMTAHLAAINVMIAANQVPGVMQSATVDKVSVTLVPPPAKNQWQYWLQSTPYGQQLLALLQVAGVGGLYIGPRPELGAFKTPRFW